jgi:formyltetrahydrofolate synthetase
VFSSKYGVPVVVAINAFASGSKGEHNKMSDCARKGGVVTCSDADYCRLETPTSLAGSLAAR